MARGAWARDLPFKLETGNCWSPFVVRRLAFQKGATVRQCPHCGGNLYLEPDLVEPQADLVCLQCTRRFPPERHAPGRWAGLSVARRPGAPARRIPALVDPPE